jgi:hypothetical protein
MADLSGDVLESITNATRQTEAAASNVSGAQLDLATCSELANWLPKMLANLLTVTERMAEGTATLGSTTPLRHKLDADPVVVLTDATQHLADLRARLGAAVASAGSYRSLILSLDEQAESEATVE